MILAMQGTQMMGFKRLSDAMHSNRGEIFFHRLGWEVNCVNGLEIDRFDELNPLYVISVDDASGLYHGSFRLLPTTGPNMLRDVFSELLPPDEIVESPVIWEASRFCVSKSVETERSANALNWTTGELLCGAFELGLQAGLSHLVAVFDDRMLKIFRRATCHPEIIGQPRVIGKTLAHAAFFEVSEQMLGRIRQASGISNSVLAMTADQHARNNAA